MPSTFTFSFFPLDKTKNETLNTRLTTLTSNTLPCRHLLPFSPLKQTAVPPPPHLPAHSPPTRPPLRHRPRPPPFHWDTHVSRCLLALRSAGCIPSSSTTHRLSRRSVSPASATAARAVADVGTMTTARADERRTATTRVDDGQPPVLVTGGGGRGDGQPPVLVTGGGGRGDGQPPVLVTGGGGRGGPTCCSSVASERITAKKAALHWLIDWETGRQTDWGGRGNSNSKNE